MKKLIIVSQDKMTEMEFEEVLKKYKPLINKEIYAWVKSYEYDELFQVCSIALWKAFENYDYTKEIGFGYIAKMYIKNQVFNYHRKEISKLKNKSSQIKSIRSLNDIVFDEKSEGVELQDLIGEDETYTEETANKLLIDKLLKKFTTQQQQDIMAYVGGYKSTELAKSKNISKQLHHNKMQAVFAKFRALYIKEMVM